MYDVHTRRCVAWHSTKAVYLCMQVVKRHDNVHKLYQQQLLREGVLKEEDVKRMSDHIGGACRCSPGLTMLAEQLGRQNGALTSSGLEQYVGQLSRSKAPNHCLQVSLRCSPAYDVFQTTLVTALCKGQW